MPGDSSSRIKENEQNATCWKEYTALGFLELALLKIWRIKMRISKEENRRESKSVEMFETLSKSELNFIRGGDDTNTEIDDKKGI